MDLRQLNALLAVAQHRSFSGAARALHTVQSNVSAHIARLERALGATLIDRSQRSLTPEGHLVARRAQRIQMELQAVTDDLASMRFNLAGTVILGVIGSAARWIVPTLLEECHRAHPSLQVIVMEATTTSLMPMLVQHRVDLAVVNVPMEHPDVETEVLYSEDRIVIVHESHELAAHKRIDLAELARHEILLPPKGTAFRDEIETDARRAQVSLRTKAEIDGMSLLASLAYADVAPALLPASVTYGAKTDGWCTVAVDNVSACMVGFARNLRAKLGAAQRAVEGIVKRIVVAESSNQPHIRAHDSDHHAQPDPDYAWLP